LGILDFTEVLYVSEFIYYLQINFIQFNEKSYQAYLSLMSYSHILHYKSIKRIPRRAFLSNFCQIKTISFNDFENKFLSVK